MSTECDTYLNIIILLILFTTIGIYIWMNYNHYQNKKQENMTIQNETGNPEYIIVRVNHKYTKYDKDTFFAFPYTNETYQILKNMHNKTLAFYADKNPSDAPALSWYFYTNVFSAKNCNPVVYCDHEQLKGRALLIANELKYGTNYKINYVSDCIGNNNDFYIRIDV